ncbi:hypothetical protein SBOR_5576 [Sclerotinia borealis F-4128]|uniref:Uncharacterized protein n=1 Tax=Sclerotinia borealis (strain F-4128) TaxID=1432307 RepID=W9CHN1_SCLBF|nr:hypothetical protein SBOR_5576 [Sclerotinia borealis F-4128]
MRYFNCAGLLSLLALEPANSAAILQNVVANEGKVLGQWSFFEYYYDGHAPEGVEEVIHGKNRNVYPGDIIESGFVSMDSSAMWVGTVNPHHWTVNWIVKRGAEGIVNREEDFAGNATMDFSLYPDMGDFTQAILATELNRAAKWDMGPVVWSDIFVEVHGTATDWCSIDKLVLSDVSISDVGPGSVFLSREHLGEISKAISVKVPEREIKGFDDSPEVCSMLAQLSAVATFANEA